MGNLVTNTTVRVKCKSTVLRHSTINFDFVHCGSVLAGKLRTTPLHSQAMSRFSCCKRLSGSSALSSCKACAACQSTKSRPSHPRYRQQSSGTLAWSSSPCAKPNQKRGTHYVMLHVAGRNSLTQVYGSSENSTASGGREHGISQMHECLSVALL